MLDTPKSNGNDGGSNAAAAKEATLPDAIRAKLMAEVQVTASPGKAAPTDRARGAPLAARLKALTAAVLPAASKAMGAAKKGAGTLAAWRPDMRALRKIQVPQLPSEVREGIIRHGRRAGLNVGVTIDSIVRGRRARETGDASTHVPDADVVASDIRTERVQRDVRQPSIFAPGHVLTAVLAGGIIHIATTFAITALGTGSAYRQVRGALPANEMVVLPPQMPGAQLLPFLMPDMLYAICRFDLAAGVVEVNAILPEVGWSLALYTRQGDNFYAAPGQSQRPVRVAFMLAPTTDRLVNLSPGARKTDVDMSQVTSPDSEGLIVVRAPLKGVAFEGTAKADLKRASCAPMRR